MNMIINVGGNSAVSAEAVKYGEFTVAETLDGLKFSTNFLSEYTSSINDAVGNVIDGLTANGKRIYLDYKDGKYGYNTSSSRGADTFYPFSVANRSCLFFKAGTSDSANFNGTLRLSCKGCTRLHIDTILQTTGTNYGSVSVAEEQIADTRNGEPIYDTDVDISEWVQSNDTIDIRVGPYKCTLELTNIYCY